jgi:hypothetical protein
MAGLSKIKTYGQIRLEYNGTLAQYPGYQMSHWLAKEAFLYGADGIKNGLASWEVVGSCDSVNFNMSGTDLLTGSSKIVFSTGNHSWIVLKQPLQGNLPEKLQVCLDYNHSSSVAYNVTVVFSIGAGFSGGSLSSRPTATDEVVVNSIAQVLINTVVNGSCGVNCVKSDDGKVTRMILSKDGILETKAYWAFEELLDVESYWTSKTIAVVAPLTHAGLNGASNLFNYQGGSNSGRLSWASTIDKALSDSGAPTTMHRPDYGGAWPVFPCGVFNDLGASRGKLGNCADLYAASYNVPNGQYFAGAGGGDFQFVNIGGIVFPWNGEPMVLP